MEEGKIHWFKWWFTGPRSLLVSPFALFLIYGCVMVTKTAFIQTFAYFAVTGAVWGKLTWVVVLFLVVPFCLILPPFAYWGCFRYLPRTIQNETENKLHAVIYFIVTLVICISIATFFQYVHGNAIGWIADIDPDAAFEVGVTGSIPPSHLIDQ
jgi:hypothetical protein